MTIGSKIPTKPKEYTQEEIQIQKELTRFKDCYIFVNTNFKRKNEPIFALAFCEYQRNITLDKNDLLCKNDEEIFTYISQIVQEHYSQTEGKIGIWGDIVNYVYHHYDGKTYLFDRDGTQIETIKVVENRATLQLDGKKII